MDGQLQGWGRGGKAFIAPLCALPSDLLERDVVEESAGGWAAVASSALQVCIGVYLFIMLRRC